MGSIVFQTDQEFRASIRSAVLYDNRSSTVEGLTRFIRREFTKNTNSCLSVMAFIRVRQDVCQLLLKKIMVKGSGGGFRVAGVFHLAIS